MCKHSDWNNGMGVLKFSLNFDLEKLGIKTSKKRSQRKLQRRTGKKVFHFKKLYKHFNTIWNTYLTNNWLAAVTERRSWGRGEIQWLSLHLARSSPACEAFPQEFEPSSLNSLQRGEFGGKMQKSLKQCKVNTLWNAIIQHWFLQQMRRIFETSTRYLHF